MQPQLPSRTETHGNSREVSALEEWPALGQEPRLAGREIRGQGSEVSRRVRKPAAAGAKFPPEARRVDNSWQQLLDVPFEDRCTFRNAAGEVIFDPHDPTSSCEQFKNYDAKYKCYVAVCG